MNTLIIFAHPEPKSLNGQLKDTAVQYLSEQGHEVQVSDLFAQNFKTQAGREDFSSYSEDFFDLQLAQQRSYMTQTVPKDIQEEQDKLRWAELIIFQFPLWWYSFPAPMKGYVDRVFSVGFAYGGRSELMGKKILLSTTTGAPKHAWTHDRKGTIEQVFFPITHGTFKLLGLQSLEPFIVYGAKQKSDIERASALEDFKVYLEGIIKS